MLELNKIHQGHILKLIKEIDDESIDCCVTSPPYYGLRSYKTEPQIWGGKENCEHEFNDVKTTLKHKAGETNPGKEHWYKNNGGSEDIGHSFCIHCGAWLGELGLEPTYELYLDHLWMIFAEVKRILKKTGTCWVNLGDSYAGSGVNDGSVNPGLNKDYKRGEVVSRPKSKTISKSLLQIPTRFSQGMTDNLGWILRNRIEWFKRSCMPSSAKDRFTVDYEDIFFMVKSKKYYFEQQFDEANYDGRKDTMFKGSAKYNDEEINPEGGVHTFAKQGHQRWKRKYDETEFGGNGKGFQNHSGYNQLENPYVRNKRTFWDLTKEQFLEWMGAVYDVYQFEAVWDVVPEPLKEAHFAVFPQALAEIMIKAGCPEGGVVFDPFMGSGTTGIVARKLNRNYLGVELQEKYFEIQEKRFHNELGFFQ